MANGIMGPMTVSSRHVVFDLNEAGLAIMRANLRRRHPRATESEIEGLLVRWLRERPGAPGGDAEGIPARRFA